MGGRRPRFQRRVVRGGPRALACAARLDAVAGVLVIAGVAPVDGEVLNFLDGMGEGHVEEFSRARDGEGPLRALMEPRQAHLRTITADELVASLATVLPEVDRTALNGEIGRGPAEQFHAAFATGIDGWLGDDLAFVRPWGSDLAEVSVPTSWWQGERDQMPPRSRAMAGLATPTRDRASRTRRGPPLGWRQLPRSDAR